jgi:PilZ domain-containing protein
MDVEQKRVAPRRRVLKAGLIAFEGTTVDCTLRNISMGGAGIELRSLVETPAAFRLIVQTDNFIHLCHVAWRNGQRLGVKFT